MKICNPFAKPREPIIGIRPHPLGELKGSFVFAHWPSKQRFEVIGVLHPHEEEVNLHLEEFERMQREKVAKGGKRDQPATRAPEFDPTSLHEMRLALASGELSLEEFNALRRKLLDEQSYHKEMNQVAALAEELEKNLSHDQILDAMETGLTFTGKAEKKLEMARERLRKSKWRDKLVGIKPKQIKRDGETFAQIRELAKRLGVSLNAQRAHLISGTLSIPSGKLKEKYAEYLAKKSSGLFFHYAKLSK